jgi:hypothetical protein
MSFIRCPTFSSVFSRLINVQRFNFFPDNFVNDASWLILKKKVQGAEIFPDYIFFAFESTVRNARLDPCKYGILLTSPYIGGCAKE